MKIKSSLAFCLAAVLAGSVAQAKVGKHQIFKAMPPAFDDNAATDAYVKVARTVVFARASDTKGGEPAILECGRVVRVIPGPTQWIPFSSAAGPVTGIGLIRQSDIGFTPPSLDVCDELKRTRALSAAATL